MDIKLVVLSAVATAFLPLAAIAEETVNIDSLTEPTEIGSTSIPAGEYTVTDKKTSKAYTLMVTKKGSMILGPGAAPTLAAPAVAPAPAPVATPAAAVTPAAVPAPAAPGAASSLANSKTMNEIKGLVQKGMQQGMGQLMKGGATSKLQNLIK